MGCEGQDGNRFAGFGAELAEPSVRGQGAQGDRHGHGAALLELFLGGVDRQLADVLGQVAGLGDGQCELVPGVQVGGGIKLQRDLAEGTSGVLGGLVAVLLEEADRGTFPFFTPPASSLGSRVSLAMGIPVLGSLGSWLSRE